MTNTTSTDNDLTSEWVLVTPELAKQWLTRNTHNRNLRKNYVKSLAYDMANGLWRKNAEAIKFDWDGRLADGQHRLHAIVSSQTPIKTLVVWGVDPDAIHTMDTGAKRTPGDMLRLRGEKNYNPLAAGIRSAINWDNGVRALGGGFGQSVTHSQILEYLDRNPEMREYASMSTRVRIHIKVPSAVSVLALKLFYEIDPEDAEHFFDRLCSDEGHYKGEPIYALRRALTDDSDSNRVSRTMTWKLAVFIKAWNKYRAGEEVKLLAYRPGGANPERFPEPI